MRAINRGFFISAVISAAAVFVISNAYMHSWKPGLAVAFGLILASVIQVLTQHFTDTKHRPVQEIAESTVTGPATTVLSGFSVGLESTVWSIIVIAGNIMAAFLRGEIAVQGDPQLLVLFQRILPGRKQSEDALAMMDAERSES